MWAKFTDSKSVDTDTLAAVILSVRWDASTIKNQAGAKGNPVQTSTNELGVLGKDRMEK